MAVIWSNMYATTLGSALIAGTVGVGQTLTVATGQGANFPAVTAPDVAYFTLIEGTHVEIVQVTAHTANADTFTVTRGFAAPGAITPTATAFTTAAKVENRVIKEALATYVNATNDATLAGAITFDKPVSLTTQSANPAAAVAGHSLLYARSLAGRGIPRVTPPTLTDDYSLQPGFFGNTIICYKPGSAAVAGVPMNGVGTAAGTLTTPVPSSAAFRSSIRRSRWANVVTTTNQALGFRFNEGAFLRGNAANMGGFFFFCRFSPELAPAGSRLFVGLTNLLTAVPITADPSTQAADFIGIGYDIADTNATIMTRDGTTATTKNAIGAGLTRAAMVGLWYDLILYAAPNASSVGVQLNQYSTTGVQTTLLDTTYATNLPRNVSASTPMAMVALASNGTANTTVNTVSLEVASLYGESNF